jgi:hypothetical protein
MPVTRANFHVVMVALDRFISKLGERGVPLFKLLNHQEKFLWTKEVDQALT